MALSLEEMPSRQDRRLLAVAAGVCSPPTPFTPAMPRPERSSRVFPFRANRQYRRDGGLDFLAGEKLVGEAHQFVCIGGQRDTVPVENGRVGEDASSAQVRGLAAYPAVLDLRLPFGLPANPQGECPFGKHESRIERAVGEVAAGVSLRTGSQNARIELDVRVPIEVRVGDSWASRSTAMPMVMESSLCPANSSQPIPVFLLQHFSYRCSLPQIS